MNIAYFNSINSIHKLIGHSLSSNRSSDPLSRQIFEDRMYFLTSEIHSIPVGGIFSFLGRISCTTSFHDFGMYRVIILITLALISAKSALERLAFQHNIYFTTLDVKSTHRYPIILIKTQLLLLLFILWLAILSDTLSFVLLQAFYIDQINRKLNCLRLTKKTRYFDLSDKAICSSYQPKILIALLE